MKIKTRSVWIGSFVLIVILAVTIWNSNQAHAEVVNLSINTQPTSFMTIPNAAPGDQYTAALKVANSGNQAFDYDISVRYVTGDAPFFDILPLTIMRGNTVLYQGLLNQLTNVDLGSLVANADDNLDFIVEFPLHLGNEYQGKTVEVAFDFVATADPVVTSPTPGTPPPSIDPTTRPSSNPTTNPTTGPSTDPTNNPSTNPTTDPTNNPSTNPTDGNTGSTPTPTPTPTTSDSTSTPSTSDSTSVPSTSDSTLTPTPAPSTSDDDIDIVEPSIPLGGGDNGEDDGMNPTDGGNGDGNGEVIVNPEPVPQGHSEQPGNPLPDTATNWYTYILISLLAAIVLGFAWRRLKR